MAVVCSRSVLLLVLVVLSSAFAGCLGDDAPAPSGADPTPAPSSSPTASASPAEKPKETPLVTVDEDSAIFAPTWTQGKAWTYAVSGSMFSNAYETTIGVVSVESDHYAMGADSTEELQNYAHFDGGVLLGGVQKDSLAIAHADTYQDLFGFRRAAGDTWEVTLFTSIFTLTKPEPTEVEHAVGTARGLEITGPASKGGNLTVVYAADVGGLALFQWVADDGTIILEYRLTAYTPSGGASGLKAWTVLSRDNGDASGPPNNIGAEQWASDGAGSFVFLRVVLRATTASGAVVVDPSGDLAVQVVGEGNQADTRWDGIVPDEAGTWSMVLWSDSGALERNPSADDPLDSGPAARSDVFLYQIEETTY